MKNKIKNKTILLGFSLIVYLTNPLCSWAQNANTLGLKDCFKAALKRSEVLATQQELVIQAEQNYHKAWSAILPSVNGSYAYFYQNAPGLSSSGNTDTSSGQQTLKIIADQPLFRGFRDFAALHKEKALIKAQELAKQWAGMRLYQDVAMAFYTCLSVQKDLALLDKELELYEKRIKALEDRISIGRSRITEVLTVQAAQAILKAQREQVLGQLDVAKALLAFITGLEPEAISLADTEQLPTDIPSLESYQLELNSRPDIIAAKKNLQAFKSNVSVAKGASLPTVDLLGNYYVERPDRHENGDWDAELSVTLPIFSAASISSDIHTAESEKRQSEIQLSLVQRMALEEIRSLYHNLKSNIAQLKALQEAFEIAEKNYNANAKDYELNLVTNLDVLQALTAYQDTKRSLEKVNYLTKINYDQLQAATAHVIFLTQGVEK
jgi:outer membrane protein